MTEKDFQQQVTELLSLLGWRWCHFRTAIGYHGRYQTPLDGYPGWPDLVAVKGRRLLFIELKSAKGKVTQGQQEWLDALQTAGQEVYVWRPDDFATLTEILQRRRTVPREGIWAFTAGPWGSKAVTTCSGRPRIESQDPDGITPPGS